MTVEAPPPVGDESLPPWAGGLPAAAVALRTLLHRVDSTATPLWAGPALNAALLRYEHIFLPMYAAHLDATGAAEKPSPLLPGRLGESLSFLHHRRLLRRQHLYFLPGYLWPPVEGTATVSGVLGSSGVGNGLPRAATVRDRWEPRPRVAALRAAAASQRVFTRRLGASGWDDPAVVRAAVARYVRFLGLASTPAGANTFLVPTTDMDLVWHAHLMATAAYEADTTAAIGRVYPHVADDDVSVRGRLASGRAATTALWAATYPEHPYEPPPSLVVPCDPASTAAKGASKPSAVDVIAASAYASGVRGGFWPAGAIERASVKAKVALREEVVAEATAAVVAMDGLVAKRPPTGLVARRAWERSLGVATAAAWRRRIGPAAVPGGGWPGLYARGYVLSAGDPLEVAATPAFVDPETARGSAGAGAVYMSASSAGTACGGWGVGGA
ncbi:hypothetical protein I4F81_011829 [Pyropia yezoensis]|uniref:Uncharacterized protein n=1 Tax=Pyropia yezoensis TaxID=2788 RepID=A0ACC3CHZ8_PYRYE|nr:hypothetical protein I4F81_011829 [Neopyropia yezoensis]